MNTYINVTLRAFKVKIFDNRTLETKIDVIVFDKSVLQAAQLVGESSDNLIKNIITGKATQLLKQSRLSSARHSLTCLNCLRQAVKSLDK